MGGSTGLKQLMSHEGLGEVIQSGRFHVSPFIRPNVIQFFKDILVLNTHSGQQQAGETHV